MNDSYSEHSVLQQPECDQEQWLRLQQELGLSTLFVLVEEFFEELEQLWFVQAPAPEQTQSAAFRSKAHRTAGTAGTIGFIKLRHVFLCMEYSASVSDSLRYLELMREVFDQTKQWVVSQR